MLEKMDVFFKNRLSDYDKHMLTTIEGADEFYKYTAALLPGEADAEVYHYDTPLTVEQEKISDVV